MTKALRLAIVRMAVASVSYALMGVFVKASTNDYPFVVALFFRAVIGATPILIHVLATRKSLKTARRAMLFFRSLSGFIAMAMFFYAIENLPLSTAVVLNFTSPIFVALMSLVFLRERNAGAVFLVALLAFVGIGILVGPDFSDSGPQMLIGLGSAFFAAIAYMSVKSLARTEPLEIIVFYFSAYSAVFSLLVFMVSCLMGFDGMCLRELLGRSTDSVSLLTLVGAGLAGMSGQLFMTSAYAVERAAVVSAFSYLNPVFSYVLGIVLFNDPITLNGISGGVLVIVATVFVVVVAEGDWQKDSSSKRREV